MNDKFEELAEAIKQGKSIEVYEDFVGWIPFYDKTFDQPSCNYRVVRTPCVTVMNDASGRAIATRNDRRFVGDGN